MDNHTHNTIADTTQSTVFKPSVISKWCSIETIPLIGVLHRDMTKFVNKWYDDGPSGEEFEDPDWDHCTDHDCKICPYHKVHHGLSDFGELFPEIVGTEFDLEASAFHNMGEYDSLNASNWAKYHIANQALILLSTVFKPSAISNLSLFDPLEFDDEWVQKNPDSPPTHEVTPCTKSVLTCYLEGEMIYHLPSGRPVYIVNSYLEKMPEFTPSGQEKQTKWTGGKNIPDDGYLSDDDWGPNKQTAISNLQKMVDIMNKENKEKKKQTVYPVNSNKRATKILEALYRFDDSWALTSTTMSREKMENTFVNSLRCSNEQLFNFIETLIDNLLKHEAKKLFKEHIYSLCGKASTLSDFMQVIVSQTAMPLIDDCYNDALSTEERRDIIGRLTEVIAQVVGNAIDDALIKTIDMGQPHREGALQRQSNLSTSDKSSEDMKETLKKYLEMSKGDIMSSIFMKGFLVYDSNDGNFDPESQKAKGVRAIALNQEYHLFYSARALHLSLDTAAVSSARDLLLSLYRTWGTGSPSRKIWTKSGFFIRTCPATPRPGALPNVLAKNEEEFIEGVRMLSQCMLNPSHSDYDPNGSLIVQRFKKPMCSGVVGKTSSSFIVGPHHDGVTAGGGSNIVFSLNARAQRYLAQDIRLINLEDGMDNHEIEFVYENPKSSSTLTWFKKTADDRHTGKNARIKPGITQMRGLHTEKMDIRPPPKVNGIVLHIAGNVPAGSVEQLVVMDVGKGSLEECLELEQMAKDGELPEGLVVYAPGGTQNAHVGGVSIDFGFPVIYGIKPKKNHTVWTEIGGWVTDMPEAEPEPYDPEPFLDFYKIGLRDGDRFWTYNLAPLSQFFHSFISGPKNDPRLEAYLGGVFTTWITKAALAVGMAELRHGLGGRCNMTPHRAFSHIMYQKAISGESGVGNLFQRSEYYRRLNYNEIGYDDLHEIAKFYAESYSEEHNQWHSNSYGGDKYFSSVNPTVKVTELVKKLMNGKNVPLSRILSQVNKLENAVHNTGFFFNKFLGDKDAFDIGTLGHNNFQSASEHWLVTAPFYAMFYTNYVNEPERVAKGHDKLIQHLQNAANRVKESNRDCDFKTFSAEEIYGMSKPSDSNQPLTESWDNLDVSDEDRDLFGIPLNNGYTMHVEGICGLDQCERQDCQNYFATKEMGLTSEEAAMVSMALSTYMSNWTIQVDPEHIPTVAQIESEITGMSTRAPEQTIFEEKERLVKHGEMKVSKYTGGSLLFHHDDDTGNMHLWIDKMLARWQISISLVSQDFNTSTAIDAWNNCDKYYPKIYAKADELDKAAAIWEEDSNMFMHSHMFNTRRLYSKGKEKWAKTGDSGFFKEVLQRMSGSNLIGHRDTNTLLKELHTETDDVLSVTQWEKIE